MKTTVTLTQQEMIDVLKKYYSVQYMTDVDVVLLPTEKEEPKPTLWYPDNSGEWIECNGQKPLHLPKGTIVQILSKAERMDRVSYEMSPNEINTWYWDSIVAYRIV